MAHRDTFFVVTEGKNTDRWYIDGVFRQSAALVQRGYVIYAISSIATSRGGLGHGKNALLAQFRRLRRSGKLTLENSSGKKHVIFFADLDHDHLTGKKMRSPHLIYTDLPDIEAHVVMDCHMHEVVAGVASLTDHEASQVVNLLGNWLHTTASGWQDWIILCCAGYLADMANSPHPGTPPTKTAGKLGPVTRECIEDLKRSHAAQCTGAERARRYSSAQIRVRQKVEKALREDAPEKLLKGKWAFKKLKHLLEEHVPAVTNMSFKTSEDSLLSAAKMHCSFNNEWDVKVRSNLESLAG